MPFVSGFPAFVTFFVYFVFFLSFFCLFSFSFFSFFGTRREWAPHTRAEKEEEEERKKRLGGGLHSGCDRRACSVQTSKKRLEADQHSERSGLVTSTMASLRPAGADTLLVAPLLAAGGLPQCGSGGPLAFCPFPPAVVGAAIGCCGMGEVHKGVFYHS